jgi:hypothetical protein
VTVPNGWHELRGVIPKAKAKPLARALLRGLGEAHALGTHPRAVKAEARAAAGDLARLVLRYRSLDRIQTSARATMRRRRHGRAGSPADVAGRDFEARVLALLAEHGFRVTDTVGTPAMEILDLVLGPFGEPRHPLRRARHRLSALEALDGLAIASR